MGLAAPVLREVAAAPARPQVPYVDFQAQYAEERDAIHACVDRVFTRADFVSGSAVAELEASLAERCGTAHAVALGSGTDALIFALKSLGVGPGDEVITAPNSFVASASCIVHVGARPVFVDVLDDQNMDSGKIEGAITPRTKAIIPVHLTGRIAEMEAINAVAAKHGLFVIEDAAQSISSRYRGRAAGALGHIGCFSTHPLKNLGAAGDGGFLTTGDGDIAARIRRLRNHGMLDRDTVAEWGYVSRMDTLQAAILNVRLGRLDALIAKRRANAERYRALLDPAFVFIPPARAHAFDTFHTFVVQVDHRDALRAYLLAQGIETFIHYPRPIHLQPAAKELGYGPGAFPVTERQAGRILSLPINQYLTPGQIETVAAAVNAFYRSQKAADHA